MTIVSTRCFLRVSQTQDWVAASRYSVAGAFVFEYSAALLVRREGFDLNSQVMPIFRAGCKVRLFDPASAGDFRNIAGLKAPAVEVRRRAIMSI